MGHLIRRSTALLAACAILLAVPATPRAQAVPAIDKRITYILPQWLSFRTASRDEVQRQVQELRSRIGEGPRVRVGFTTYLALNMANVDPSDVVAVRAALGPTFADVDDAIQRGVTNGIPIALSFLTAIRAPTDPLQDAAQAEDRRNIQWHSDQSMATGWTTLSRYARKQERIQEAFVRELGRFLASRMALYPETLVATSGDGEIELSYERSFQIYPNDYTPATSLIADYSPFAVAEFRDWLRGAGLYAPGQPFAGEAYANSARYGSLANVNADFGTTFTNWELRYFDWSLSDNPDADSHAIPASAYNAGGWNPTPANSGGFDPPRVHQRGNAWSDLWDLFRQTMVWRHNREFAKWLTTSVDSATGATVPADRWFTDQIPADYLFGFTAPNPDFRLDTSASPFWTADVTPYGSLGITSFNSNVNGVMYKTLAAVAPQIAQRKVRWGIFEWSPSVPVNADVTVYRDEMALVERYRPSVLAPFYWQSTDYPIENTGFEIALRELVNRIKVIPLTLSRPSLVTAATTSGAATPAQTVRVGGAPGETPPWSIASSSPFLTVAVTADGRGFTVTPQAQGLPPGTRTGSVVVSSSDPGYSAATLTVTLNVTAAGASAAPVGSFDTPADNAVVSGEVGVTGWVVDDIGVASVDIYRTTGDAPAASLAALIPLGTATFVPGARTDVEAAYPTKPQSEQAGWGYMLLTNMLPNQGNGTFYLYAIARDVEGHTVVLEKRRIICQNAASQLPFGTIDTPGQGATVSGTIVNFGWALSPSSLIPIDGSTIGVYIDNVFVGRPTYNQVRSDIATLFPNYPNTDASAGRGAIGYFYIDTTAYANGVHTIAWVVTDGAGGARGIGSRYFTIANP